MDAYLCLLHRTAGTAVDESLHPQISLSSSTTLALGSSQCPHATAPSPDACADIRDQQETNIPGLAAAAAAAATAALGGGGMPTGLEFVATPSGTGGGGSSSEQDPKSSTDPKSQRRLAQNREAARKNRLRRKAYVQQLESSRIRLQQLEEELARVKSQQQSQDSSLPAPGSTTDTSIPALGLASAAGNSEEKAGSLLEEATARGNHNANAGAAAFDLEYSQWGEEQHRLLCDLRAALQSSLPDSDLRALVENVLAHYDELFRIKAIAAKADVLYLISGMWRTAAERCFLWMGGFKPSELLKVLVPHLEPLEKQQLMGICNLQVSSENAEEALSKGMETLQQSLAEALSAGSLGGASSGSNNMGHALIAMGRLNRLEKYVKQADSIRQETLYQMYHILTIRQAARGLLAMGDYFARFRALSSLWAERPGGQ